MEHRASTVFCRPTAQCCMGELGDFISIQAQEKQFLITWPSVVVLWSAARAFSFLAPEKSFPGYTVP